MTSKSFAELGLSPELLKAVARLGFEQASPIQAESIPVLLSGRDLVGQSQTGSGKTAAFGIPAIEKTDPNLRAVQVLILCPTRELAVQVSGEIHKLALFKRGIQALPIYGGQSYERQFYGLNQGAQIVIGTPGRLLDHLRRGTLRLDAVKMVVLDEADVMLDMGFREDIEAILQTVPAERQTAFFSATMPRPIRELIAQYARTPQSIHIEQKAVTVATVEQIYYEVDRRFKVELLTRLIDLHDLQLGIIFCNTKRMVDDLVDALEAQGYQADRLHGDMTQAMRDRVMNKFRKSAMKFLVATDIAARGIDVDDVQVVFNYDLPYDVEDYVHRIGRTGRAGRSGRAISFVSGRELFQIRNIERYTNQRLQRGRIPTTAEVEDARADLFLGKIRAALLAGDGKRNEFLVERLLEEGFSSADIASACLTLLQAESGDEPAGATKSEPPKRAARFDADTRRPDRRNPTENHSVHTDRRERTRPPLRPDSSKPTAPSSWSRPAATAAAQSREKAAPPRIATTPVTAPTPSENPVKTVIDEPQSPASAKAPGSKVLPPTTKPRVAPPRPAPAPLVPESETPATPAKAAVVKTYSDEEIPASAKSPTPVPSKSGGSPHLPPWATKKRDRVPPEKAPRPSRATPRHQTRLWMNLGVAHQIRPADIVTAISGETGLPAKVVGTVDIREKHLFVDVNQESANIIVSRLKRAQIKGHKVKVKVA
ncbi:MAG TPA: DEAD/DEAH box helicase [Verrucomicrobiota bacterium]|nr:DEAD/DEAH box helicase [Verrucomicrobiota bacterium]HNT15397.1 DEAD/DEAH box helicase [Verrucomicrobiota bacterium]